MKNGQKLKASSQELKARSIINLYYIRLLFLLMKYRLNQDDITEDFFCDTKLIGIMCDVKNYQFCWLINKELGLHFKLNTDIEIQVQKKGRNAFFPVYQFTQSEALVAHFIYKNLYEGEYLLPEFRHLDFLWLIKGEGIDEINCDEMILSLRNINGVQLVAELSNEKIQKKGNLIF